MKMNEIIEIVFNKVVVNAELNDSLTAQKILKTLPIKSGINLWGSEIYFEIDTEAELEDGKEVMNAGDIAFWPPGSAFCIFFGPTPASSDSRPRAVSPVTVIGRITDYDSIEKIKKIKETDMIEIRKKA
jgi:uncharacterized protein